MLRSTVPALPPAVCTGLALAMVLLSSADTFGQTSPAFGPLPAAPAAVPGDDMPLADYLGLLEKIAPAANEAARTYLAATQLRCGRALTVAELHQAMSQGDGDPVLMGLIRAAHIQDTAARSRLVAQIPCAPKGAR